MTSESAIPVVVSACLLGRECRHDGTAATNQAVIDAAQDRYVVEICPEVDGGLSVPRKPAEIVGGDGYDVLDGRARVVNLEGGDCTAAFLAGARVALRVAYEHGVREAWLKSLSPACGCGTIYDGTFSGKARRGVGVAAALLMRNGICCIQFD